MLISLGMAAGPVWAQSTGLTGQMQDLSENRLIDADIQPLNNGRITAADDAEALWKANQDFFIDHVGSIEPDGRFSVSPTLFTLNAQRGDTITQIIYVISSNPDPTTFYLSVEDYEGTTDLSKSHVLLGEEDSEYGARHWANLPVEQFTLNMGERANIKITFTVPDYADPGEHYAAVLVARAPRATEMDGDAQISVISRVGTMFMLNVAGQTRLEGELVDFSLARRGDDKVNNVFANVLSKSPAVFNLTYRNPGTTHLGVQGTLEITNLFGRAIEVVNPDAIRRSERHLGTTALALEKFNILRGSVRSQEVMTGYVDREIPLFFGPYKARLTIDDGTGIQKTESVAFWYIPFPQTPIVAGVIVLLVLTIVIRKRIKKNKGKSILD